MSSQDGLTLAAMLLFGMSFGAFWMGVFWFGRMVQRLERTTDVVKSTLDRMERETFAVADGRVAIAGNLADAVSRARATEGVPGEAADAALRTGDSAAEIHRRQDRAHDSGRGHDG